MSIKSFCLTIGALFVCICLWAQAPTADFTSTATSGCAPAIVGFQDNSTGNITSWKWDFGNCAASSVKNPATTYFNPGVAAVNLTNSNVSETNTVAQTGGTESLSGPSFIAIQKPTHSLNNEIKGRTNPTADFSRNFTTNPPIANFTFRPDCEDLDRQTYIFTDLSVDAETWTWDFGDGSAPDNRPNPTHKYTRKDAYIVSLTVTNGVYSNKIRYAVNNLDQTPSFTASIQAGCRTFSSSFTASSPVPLSALLWDFGEGKIVGGYEVVKQFTKVGNFDVKLYTIDAYGCWDSLVKPNFIHVSGPTANFTSNTNAGCLGIHTDLEDNTTTNGTNPITNWMWDFGDGSAQSTEQSPSHQYDVAGSYNVKLVVEDAAGCTDSLIQNDFVKISTIKADWNAITESCVNSNITFNNATTSTFAYSSWWNMGDGRTLEENSPTTTYQDSGYHTIMLRVKDIAGCEDSLEKQNYIHIEKTVADFTANNLTSYCPPFEAKFTNTSTNFISHVWEFQGTTSYDRDIVAHYPNPTMDIVKLTVTGPGGCTDVMTKAIEVKDASEALLTYDRLIACTSDSVRLQAFAPMNGARFIWDLGDGNIIDTTVNSLAYAYKDLGKHLPKVTLKDQCTISLTGKDSILIKGANVRFGINKKVFCDNGTITLTDSTVSENPVVSLVWNFGDGILSTLKNPSHFYRKTGIYRVRLDAETQEGCKSSAFATVQVIPTPHIKIDGKTDICIGDKIQYKGIFTKIDTSAVNWVWQFPNGITSNLQNPTLQSFAKLGNYQVKALVITSSGCTDSARIPLRVHEMPTTEIPSPLTTYTGSNLAIPATYSPDITHYKWTPAQGLSCTDCPQPVFTGNFSNTYLVTATNDIGCTSSSNVTITVLCKGSDLFVPNTFSPNRDGRNDIFYIRGKGMDRVKSFRIYNRWGEMVFERKDVPLNIESEQYGWNGIYKGNKPIPDVYVYQIEVFCNNGEIIRTEGSVALIQ